MRAEGKVGEKRSKWKWMKTCIVKGIRLMRGRGRGRGEAMTGLIIVHNYVEEGEAR